MGTTRQKFNLILVLAVMLTMAQTAWAGNVNIKADGQIISDATTWENGVVSITGNTTITFSERIIISGSVTIDLGVGTTLVASSGIEVDEGNELTIEGDGALNAIVADNFYAAIGRGFHGNTPGTSGIININGGIITATGGKFAAGIGGGDTGAGGTININGGTIVATGGYLAAGIGGGVYGAGGVINISGGQVTAISDDRASGIGPGYKGGSGTVALGWTNNDDFIYATNYDNVEKLTLDDEFYFVDNGEHVIATTTNIGGKTLYPLIDKNTLEYANISGIEPYYRYTGNDIEITYTVTDLEGNPMEYGKDYTAKFSPSTIKEKGDYTLTIMAAGDHYTGSKSISFSVVDNIAVTASTTEMNEKYGVPYKVSNDVHVDSRIKIVGDILLVLDEGETLTASKGIELSKGNKLTIEGNGNLTATGDGNNAGIGALEVGTLIINSGNITATGGDEGSAGIGGSKTNYQGNTDGGFITINGGSVNATGSPYAAAIGGSLMGVCGSITINGGKVTANGGIHVVAGNNVNGYGIGSGYKGTKSGTITLGWTDEDDFIYFSSIADVENIRFAAGKNFYYTENDANVVAIIDNIENKTLHPYLEKVDFENVSIRGIKPYYPYTGNNIDIEYEVYDAGGNKLTINDDYTAEFSQTPINGKGDYTLTVTAASGSNFTGSKSLTFHVVDYISVTAETTTMTADYGLSYRVDDNVTVDERITINGDVMLFLDKDKTLNASKGVELSAGNKLTIEGRGILQASGEDSKAGIGAREVGMLVVNGNVLAKGGNNAAGIGGSSNNTSGGTIIINSGEIVAKGGLGAAGIGGGLVGPCGTVSINGGKIVAEGGIYGDLISSGIGPGDYGQKSGTVTLGWTTENDLVFANNFNNVETLRVADGKAFTASTGKVYIGTLDDDQRAEIASKTLKPVICTGVTLKKESQGLTAIIDGTSTETINIPKAITVDDVKYNRTFTVGKASTVMLPFNYICTGNEGGTFYEFVGIEEDGGKWVATMQGTGDDANNAGTLTANTPYLFLPTETGITFTIPNTGVSLCTAGDGNCQMADASGNWTFKGTYSYIKWTTDTNDDGYSEEHATEIGTAYGFAGVEKTGIEVGDFVKVASGAKVRPTSCYLKWTGDEANDSDTNAAKASGMSGAASVMNELPQTITVKLIDANGETTAIGEIDTKTGDITFDGWWTLDGVRLDGKPSKSGVYINNSKKVVVE
ncbi:MAG: hypothetical protein J5932_06725 [Prevotella sp.]|nr:hypothetical protein [Prevotella sp.]